MKRKANSLTGKLLSVLIPSLLLISCAQLKKETSKIPVGQVTQKVAATDDVDAATGVLNVPKGAAQKKVEELESQLQSEKALSQLQDQERREHEDRVQRSINDDRKIQ